MKTVLKTRSTISKITPEEEHSFYKPKVLSLTLTCSGTQIFYYDAIDMASLSADFQSSCEVLMHHGMSSDSVEISVLGRHCMVYTVMQYGLCASTYKPFLERMSRDETFLHHWPLFEDAIKVHVGIKTPYPGIVLPNAWFDVTNHIAWVLSLGEQQLLQCSLEWHAFPRRYVN